MTFSDCHIRMFRGKTEDFSRSFFSSGDLFSMSYPLSFLYFMVPSYSFGGLVLRNAEM